MARRYVYWSFDRRKAVLTASIQVMHSYPDTIDNAKRVGKFKNGSVLNHCFNVAQEMLSIPEEERRGKMTVSDVLYFNKFYNQGNV